MESFETRSCITNITGCLFLRFVYPVCSVLVAFVSLSLLAPGIGLFVFYTFVRRPRTKPLLRKTWATWCVAYVMGRAIRRITPRRLRACHLSGASIFERHCESPLVARRCSSRDRRSVHFILFGSELGFETLCVDLVYDATAAHRKHVADIFTNLRFVFLRE